MKKWLITGAAVGLLAGCGSQGPVGANSADSITTTAVGNVVATLPSPTPTPVDAVTATNASDATADSTTEATANAAE